MFLNKVTIAGNLGQDPEVKFMPDGTAVCNFSLATTDYWKDKQTGEKKESTEWHNIVIFGKLAEIVGKHFVKGSPIYLEGKIRTLSWKDKDNGKNHYKTEIVCNEMQFMGSKSSSDQPAAQSNPSSNQANAGANAKAKANNNASNAPISELFTPAEVKAIQNCMPVKVNNNDPKKAEKLVELKANDYTWKGGKKEWSPKAA